jgi:4-hydroxybenzoate polyprenyltransferase
MPHLFGTIYAGILPQRNEYRCCIAQLFKINILLFGGTASFRAAACAWNDIQDREFDRKVLQYRLRAIARGAVSPLQGLIFKFFLTILALVFMVPLPSTFAVASVPDIFLLALYPFAKRFTEFPQVILGFQVGYGIFSRNNSHGRRHPNTHKYTNFHMAR